MRGRIAFTQKAAGFLNTDLLLRLGVTSLLALLPLPLETLVVIELATLSTRVSSNTAVLLLDGLLVVDDVGEVSCFGSVLVRFGYAYPRARPCQQAGPSRGNQRNSSCPCRRGTGQREEPRELRPTYPQRIRTLQPAHHLLLEPCMHSVQ